MPQSAQAAWIYAEFRQIGTGCAQSGVITPVSSNQVPHSLKAEAGGGVGQSELSLGNRSDAQKLCARLFVMKATRSSNCTVGPTLDYTPPYY